MCSSKDHDTTNSLVYFFLFRGLIGDFPVRLFQHLQFDHIISLFPLWIYAEKQHQESLPDLLYLSKSSLELLRMKSPPIDDNGMVNGYLVYRRRKKRTSSEAIYLNSEACKGKVDDHVHMSEHAAEKDRVSVERHEDVTVKPKSPKTSSADKVCF